MEKLQKIIFAALICICFTACSNSGNKYTHTRYRFGTVFLKNGTAGLSLDLFQDLSFINFSKEADFDKFDVKPGDRVLAQIYIEETGITTYELLSADKLIISYPSFSVPKSADSFFRFQYTEIDPSFMYGEIWSNGHYINCGLVAQTDAKDNSNIYYYLYPDTVVNDTFCLRLYADIPNPCEGKNAISRLLTFDMSSLTMQLNNVQEEQHRKEIVDALKAKRSSAITVKISSADTTRITNAQGKLVEVPSFSRKTTLSLDFLKN